MDAQNCLPLLQVLVSLAAVAAFALGVIPLIGHYAGISGIVKFWLMPWLGYHFWMSTFTVVHHTAPHIPFKPANEWNAAKAQLSGTVHCDYPKMYVLPLNCSACLALAKLHVDIGMPIAKCLEHSESISLWRLISKRPVIGTPYVIRLQFSECLMHVQCGVSVPRHQCPCASPCEQQNSLVQPAGSH